MKRRIGAMHSRRSGWEVKWYAFQSRWDWIGLGCIALRLGGGGERRRRRRNGASGLNGSSARGWPRALAGIKDGRSPEKEGESINRWIDIFYFAREKRERGRGREREREWTLMALL